MWHIPLSEPSHQLLTRIVVRITDLGSRINELGFCSLFETKSSSYNLDTVSCSVKLGSSLIADYNSKRLSIHFSFKVEMTITRHLVVAACLIEVFL